MINSPPKVVIESLADLRGSHHFERILEWLKDELAQRDKDNRTIEADAQLRRSQGAAETLADIIGYAEDAREIIARARRTRP